VGQPERLRGKSLAGIFPNFLRFAPKTSLNRDVIQNRTTQWLKPNFINLQKIQYEYENTNHKFHQNNKEKDSCNYHISYYCCFNPFFFLCI